MIWTNWASLHWPIFAILLVVSSLAEAVWEKMILYPHPKPQKNRHFKSITPPKILTWQWKKIHHEWRCISIISYLKMVIFPIAKNYGTFSVPNRDTGGFFFVNFLACVPPSWLGSLRECHLPGDTGIPSSATVILVSGRTCSEIPNSK